MSEIPKRPNWVTDSLTPQELIDRAYNAFVPADQRYFKPPENAEESATYYERLSAWQASWVSISADPADWPPGGDM